jgi:hypothetical protein
VPFITSTRQPAPDLFTEHLAELQHPLPHRLMADRDAAGGEDLVDMAQAEWKAEIEPNRMADDLAWEAVAGVMREVCPAPQEADNSHQRRSHNRTQRVTRKVSGLAQAAGRSGG